MEKQPVKVFIASSAEVKDEREKCIVILNEINKSHPHLNLEPVEWEYDLPKGSFPNFEAIQNRIPYLCRTRDHKVERNEVKLQSQ